MALNVSTFVDITTRISAGGVPRGQFGRGLLVTVDDTLAAGGSGKVQVFADNNAVSDTFDGDVADDAAVWFSADSPPKPLYVGRWANAAVGTTLARWNACRCRHVHRRQQHLRSERQHRHG